MGDLNAIEVVHAFSGRGVFFAVDRGEAFMDSAFSARGRAITSSVLTLTWMTFLIVGCSIPTPSDSQFRKIQLRKILDPGFVLSSIPKENEEEFYRILETFAEDRRDDEFVSEIEFSSSTEVTLLFSDGGMHGGGCATAKKKNGQWIIEDKMYFL